MIDIIVCSYMHLCLFLQRLCGIMAFTWFRRKFYIINCGFLDIMKYFLLFVNMAGGTNQGIPCGRTTKLHEGP